MQQRHYTGRPCKNNQQRFGGKLVGAEGENVHAHMQKKVLLEPHSFCPQTAYGQGEIPPIYIRVRELRRVCTAINTSGRLTLSACSLPSGGSRFASCKCESHPEDDPAPSKQLMPPASPIPPRSTLQQPYLCSEACGTAAAHMPCPCALSGPATSAGQCSDTAPRRTRATAEWPQARRCPAAHAAQPHTTAAHL